MFKLRLYVVGQTPRSVKAIDDLRALLEDRFKGQYTLEVIDILKNPRFDKESAICRG